jgi:hypothetical protein
MSQTLKVTMSRIEFDRAGDDGSGETYWDLMADGQVIASRSRSNARKTKNGETVVIGQSGTVTKGDNQTLVVNGSVGDADGFLKGDDDSDSFSNAYTNKEKFGIGDHVALVQDRKRHLSAKVYYTIAAA